MNQGETGEAALNDLPKPKAVRLNRASGRIRRPATADDIEKIREAITDQRTSDIAEPPPVFRYLTVDGITGDTRTQTQTRHRANILVAHRLAAIGRPLTYQPTGEGLALGIAGEDATDRLTGLKTEIDQIAKRLNWTITTRPEDWTVPEEPPDEP